MINSNSFSDNELEDISAHCFRATLAVKKYKEGGAILAQKALNHKNSGTTLSHYIKINERNIDINEENKYKNNKIIDSSFNYSGNNPYFLEGNLLSEEAEDSENEDSIEIDEYDKSEEKKLFNCNISKKYNEENKIFLNKKRNIKSIIKKDSLFSKKKEFNNLFESVLENSKNSNNEEIKIRKEALKESGRLFVPTVQTKKETYLSSEFVPGNIKTNDFEETDEKIINDIMFLYN